MFKPNLFGRAYKQPSATANEDGIASITFPPFTVAASGTADVFTPAAIAGLELWLRADLGTTIATGVSAWADQSGTGDTNKNVAQAVGALQPTVNASDAAYNHQKTLSFSSLATQYLQSGTWTTPPPTTATIFIVGNNDGGSGSTDETFVDSLSAQRYLLDNDATVGVLRMYLSGNVNATVDVSVPSIMGFTMIANSTSAVYVNAKTALATGNPGTSTPTGLTLGANYLGGASLNGKIAEIIIYNSDIGATKRALIWKYLSMRYGISVGA